MTTAIPGFAPANDQELIRSFHERIRAIDNRTARWIASDALREFKQKMEKMNDAGNLPHPRI